VRRTRAAGSTPDAPSKSRPKSPEIRNVTMPARISRQEISRRAGADLRDSKKRPRHFFRSAE
jgi:hypothetical protein